MVDFFYAAGCPRLLFFSTVSKLRDEITASHEGQFCGIKWSRFYVFLSAIFKMCDHLFFCLIKIFFSIDYMEVHTGTRSRPLGQGRLRIRMGHKVVLFVGILQILKK